MAVDYDVFRCKIHPKRTLRLANKEWFNIIHYDNFRIYLANDNNFFSITEHLSKIPHLISLSFAKSKLDMPVKDVVSAISILTNLRSFIFKERLAEDITFEDWMKLTNLTNIEEWEFLRWQNPPPGFITKFLKIRKLVLSAGSKELAQILKGTPNLECLKLNHSGKFSIDPFTQLQNPSKLTKLYLRVVRPTDASVEKFKQFCNLKVLEYESFGTEIIDIHLDQLTSLESLKLCTNEALPFHTNTNLTYLRMLCDNIPVDHLNQYSQLKKLRELYIYWPSNAEYKLFEFLTAMTDLQKFDIDDSTPDDDIRDRNKDRLLANLLSTTLKSLVGNFEVQSLIQFEKLESLELRGVTNDLDYLRYLTNLTSLEAYSANNISTVNALTKLKSLDLNGRKIPRDYEQLNLDQLTILERLAIPLLAPLASIVNNLSKLSKLSALTLNINLKDEDFAYNFDNLKLTSFCNGTNSSEKLIDCLVKITTLRRLVFYHWRSEENVLLFTALNHLTFLRISPAEEGVFFGRHLSALTSLQDIRGLGNARLAFCENLTSKMPYLRHCS